MSCLAAFVCVFVLYGRWRGKRSLAVPLAVIGFAVVRATAVFAILAGTFKDVGSLRPEDKATILAAGISETVNSSAWLELATIPLLIAAVIVDRRLTRVKPAPALVAAPTDARCAVHANAAAILACGRCGAFMCTPCAHGPICAACAQRS